MVVAPRLDDLTLTETPDIGEPDFASVILPVIVVWAKIKIEDNNKADRISNFLIILSFWLG